VVRSIWIDSQGGANAAREVGGEDVAKGGAGACGEIRINGRRWWGVEGAKRHEKFHEAEDRADYGIAGAAVANFLAAHPVLLASKGERGKCSGAEVVEGTRARVDGARTDPQGDIPYAKEAVLDVVGLAHVLARAQEEENTKREEACLGQSSGAVFSVCEGNDLAQQGHGQRLDS
jgi:hypothetical protein